MQSDRRTSYTLSMQPTCKVFLMEDREDDAHLLRQAIADCPTLALVHHAKNAKEAVSYLLGAGVYSDRARYPLPNVLILDLEMPNEGGFQVLNWLRDWSGASTVRVVALAAHEHPSYLTRASDLGARCCLEKPRRGSALRDFARRLEDWCRPAPR